MIYYSFFTKIHVVKVSVQYDHNRSTVRSDNLHVNFTEFEFTKHCKLFYITFLMSLSFLLHLFQNFKVLTKKKIKFFLLVVVNKEECR